MKTRSYARKAKREGGRKLRQRRLGPRAAARRIGNYADPVAARRLSAREIEHMAEQPANGRAQDMQDVEGSGRQHRSHLINQYQRLASTTMRAMPKCVCDVAMQMKAA
jgi:hypothetical protein